MATRNETHVHDNSTLANFKDWASSFGLALAAFGWIQGNDTGQAVWTATVLTLTQVTVGATAVYSYSSFTGPAPRVGMSVIFTGFATGGNNVTATLTAVSGGASGTVTVVLTTQANETHAGSGTTTASANPTSTNSVYEIWTPGDGLTTFNMRLDMGLNSTSPWFKIQIGTTTNGAGTLTGTTTTLFYGSQSPNSGATLYNCLFSGGTGWFACMMWRDLGGNVSIGWAIERSKDASGNDTSTYITKYLMHFNNVTGGGQGYMQQSIVFGVGATTFLNNGTTRSWTAFLSASVTNGGSAISQTFNGNTAISPLFPMVGYFDNPSLGIAVAAAADFSELATLTATMYGSTHTWLFSKTGAFAGASGTGMAIRWE